MSPISSTDCMYGWLRYLRLLGENRRLIDGHRTTGREVDLRREHADIYRAIALGKRCMTDERTRRGVETKSGDGQRVFRNDHFGASLKPPKSTYDVENGTAPAPLQTPDNIV